MVVNRILNHRRTLWIEEKLTHKTFRVCWRCHKKFRQWCTGCKLDVFDCESCAREMYNQAQIALGE